VILSFFRKSFSRPYDDAYYTGEFSAGGEREGQGILEFENGQRYHFYAQVPSTPCCVTHSCPKPSLPLRTHNLCMHAHRRRSRLIISSRIH
jgi:hypothetical protein